MDGGPRFSIVIGIVGIEKDPDEKRGTSHKHRVDSAIALFVFGGGFMERHFHGADRFGIVLSILGGSLPGADRLFVFEKIARLEIKARV